LKISLTLPQIPWGDELEILGVLIDNYEKVYFPIDLPDPIEAIKFRMDQAGLKPTDMKAVFGTSNRFYEIMRGTRNLTLPMILKLHHEFGVPAESLLSRRNGTDASA